MQIKAKVLFLKKKKTRKRPVRDQWQVTWNDLNESVKIQKQPPEVLKFLNIYRKAPVPESILLMKLQA